MYLETCSLYYYYYLLLLPHWITARKKVTNICSSLQKLYKYFRNVRDTEGVEFRTESQ